MTIKSRDSSPFYDEYEGGLSLIESPGGRMYIEDSGVHGPDYFGPLTEQQVNAFRLLCEVPRVEFLDDE